MVESLPGLLLVLMIAITLVLLPYVNGDKAHESRRVTEEIRLNVRRDRDSHEEGAKSRR